METRDMSSQEQPSNDAGGPVSLVLESADGHNYRLAEEPSLYSQQSLSRGTGSVRGSFRRGVRKHSLNGSFASRGPSPIPSDCGKPDSLADDKQNDIDEAVPTDSSLYVFSVDHPVRAACIAVVSTRAFARFIMGVIFLNSIVLAADQPALQKPRWFVDLIFYSDIVFTSIYTLELVLKVIALGFILHDGSYMRSTWNIADFIIVVTALLSYGLPVGDEITAVRLFRLIRPLRSVRHIPALQALVTGLLHALPPVLNNLLLLFFLLIVFAVLAVQLWEGVLDNRCYIMPWDMPSYNGTYPILPVLHGSDTANCGGAHDCPAPALCLNIPDIFHEDHYNYDNVFAAMLVVFKVVSMDDWPDDMAKLMNAAGSFTSLFFIALTILGNYLLVNLFLGILTQAYTDVQQAAHEEANAGEDDGEEGELEEHDRSGSACLAVSLIDRECSEVGCQTEDALDAYSGGEDVVPPNVVVPAEDDASPSFMMPTSPNNRANTAPSNNNSGDLRQRTVQMTDVESVALSQDEYDEEDMSPAMRAIQRLRRRAEWCVNHTIIENIILVVTILNVVVLAIDHYKIPQDTSKVLDDIGLACTVVFTVEIVVKLLSMGVIRTLTQPFNVFDFLLVVLAYIEIALDSGSGLSAFRAVRLLRVLRLIRTVPTLQALIRMILKATSSAVYLSMLILLFIFVYAIVGMQLFGTRFSSSDLTFGWLVESLILCFIVITGDSYSDLVKTGMAINPWSGSIFFLSLFFIGNFVLINFFVAIIMQHFDEELSRMEQSRKEENIEIYPPILVLPTIPVNQEVAQVFLRVHFAHKGLEEDGSAFVPLDPEGIDPYVGVTGNSLFLFGPKNFIRRICYRIVDHDWFTNIMLFVIAANLLFLAIDRPSKSETESYMLHIVDYIFTIIFLLEMVAKIIAYGAWWPEGVEGVPRHIAPPPAYFRSILNGVDAFVAIMALIGLFVPIVQVFRALRSIRLVMLFDMTRVVILSVLKALPQVAQCVVLCGFIFLLFSILGVNLLKGTFYDCTDPRVEFEWQCTGTSTVSAAGPYGPINETIELVWRRFDVHFDHVGGALYTLFQVAVGDGWAAVMFMGVDAVGPGKGPRLHHNLPMALFFISFFVVANFFAINLMLGILVNYFVKVRNEIGASTTQTEAQQNSVRAKFAIERATIQRHDVDEVPSNPIRKFFFILVTHPPPRLGSNKPEKQYEGSTAVAVENDSAAFSPRSLRAQSAGNFNQGGQDKKDIVTWEGEQAEEDPESKEPEWSLFDIIVTLLIVLNLVILAVQYRGMNKSDRNVLFIMNFVLSGIFIAEALFKIIGLGPWVYFHNSWNVFDFVVVVLTIVGWILDFGPGASAARIFRVFRALRLIRRARGLNTLFLTLVRTLPSLVNVTLVLLVVFFTYGVIGVALFGKIERNGPITEINNFENILNAVLVLYQIVTTEGWTDVMNACRYKPPGCEISDTCGSEAAIPYFLTFMVIGSFITLQLFVAVVVENYVEKSGEGDDEEVDPFVELKRTWLRELGVRKEISCQEFINNIVPKLPPSLTGCKDNSRRTRQRLLFMLEIPVRKGLLHYDDIVTGFVQRMYPTPKQAQVQQSKQLSLMRRKQTTFGSGGSHCGSSRSSIVDGGSPAGGASGRRKSRRGSLAVDNPKPAKDNVLTLAQWTAAEVIVKRWRRFTRRRTGQPVEDISSGSFQGQSSFFPSIQQERRSTAMLSASDSNFLTPEKMR